MARIVAIGLSHKTAPVEQREKASLDGNAVRAVLRAVAADPRLDAGAALSTCNRTELYAVAGRLGPAEEALRDALVEHSRIDRPQQMQADTHCRRPGGRERLVHASAIDPQPAERGSAGR